MPVSGEAAAPRVIQGPELQKAAVDYAATREAARRLKAGSKEQILADEANKKLGDKKAQESLTVVATGLKETGSSAETRTERMIFTNEKGGKREARDATETTRADGVKQTYAAIETFLLDPSSCSAPQKKLLIDAAKSTIMKNAEWKAGFADSSGNIDEAKVFIYLQTSECRAMLTDKLNSIMDEAAKADTDLIKINEDLRKNKSTQLVESNKLKPLYNKRTAVTDASKELQKFQNDKTYPPGSTTETRQAAYDRLLNDLSGSSDLGVRSFDKNIIERDSLNAKKDSGVALTTTEQQHLGDLTAWIEGSKNHPQFGAKCAEAEQLHNERQRITNNINLANDPNFLTNLENQISEAEQRLLDLKMAEDDLTFERKNLSRSFEQGIKEVVQTSVAEVMNNQITEFLTAYPQYEKEALSVLEEAARRKLHEHLNGRYGTAVKKGIPFFRTASLEWDIKKMEDDRKLLFSTKPPNPDGLIEKYMIDSSLSDAEKAAILNNPNTMQILRGDLVGKLIIATSQAGHIMPEEEMRVLAETDWGGSAIKNMISKNQEIRQIVEQACGQGYAAKDALHRFGPVKLIAMLMMALGLLAGIKGVPLNEA